MGLSSSQGRLLMLTSRLSDIELAQIMISQRQNQLAWDTEKVAKQYNNAVSNYKLQIKVENKGDIKNEDITFNNMYNSGLLIMDNKGNVYLPKTEDENGNIKLDDSKIAHWKNTMGVGGSYDLPSDAASYVPADATPYINDPQLLQNAIMNGLLFVYNLNNPNQYAPASISVLESETGLEKVLDTSDDALAQSKYDYELSRIKAQENTLEMDMKQLETQHEAIVKEYDSVKEVISSNVERTFKLFSKG